LTLPLSQLTFFSLRKYHFSGSGYPPLLEEEKSMRHRNLVLFAFAVLIFVTGVPARNPESWPVSTPETVGLDPKVLAAFDADIAAGKYGYVDSMLVIRRGKLVYDHSYRHDYDKIYGKEAKEQSALNAHDPTGPYNYFNPWWHPFYRRDLHTSIGHKNGDLGHHRPAGVPDLSTPILKFSMSRRWPTSMNANAASPFAIC
jgi:hypothetical protein